MLCSNPYTIFIKLGSTLQAPWRSVFEECCNTSNPNLELPNNNNNNLNNICPDGFVHNPALNVCDDVDECDIGGGHDCNQV